MDDNTGRIKPGWLHAVGYHTGRSHTCRCTRKEPVARTDSTALGSQSKNPRTHSAAFSRCQLSCLAAGRMALVESKITPAPRRRPRSTAAAPAQGRPGSSADPPSPGPLGARSLRHTPHHQRMRGTGGLHCSSQTRGNSTISSTVHVCDTLYNP